MHFLVHLAKLLVLVSAAFGLGASFGFGVEPFGKVGFGLAVSAGFTSGFGVEPFGKVGFGLAVSAGFTSGFGVEPFGKVGFGLAVSAGFTCWFWCRTFWQSWLWFSCLSWFYLCRFSFCWLLRLADQIIDLILLLIRQSWFQDPVLFAF